MNAKVKQIVMFVQFILIKAFMKSLNVLAPYTSSKHHSYMQDNHICLRQFECLMVKQLLYSRELPCGFPRTARIQAITVKITSLLSGWSLVV